MTSKTEELCVVSAARLGLGGELELGALAQVTRSSLADR